MSITQLKKFVERVNNSLIIIDLYCDWYGIESHKNKQKIVFDDQDGGYIELTFYSNYARFTSGNFLTTDEKQLYFYYGDPLNIEAFVNDFSKFVIRYFKSIKQYIGRNCNINEINYAIKGKLIKVS